MPKITKTYKYKGHVFTLVFDKEPSKADLIVAAGNEWERMTKAERAKQTTGKELEGGLSPLSKMKQDTDVKLTANVKSKNTAEKKTGWSGQLGAQVGSLPNKAKPAPAPAKVQEAPAGAGAGLKSIMAFLAKEKANPPKPLPAAPAAKPTASPGLLATMALSSRAKPNGSALAGARATAATVGGSPANPTDAWWKSSPQRTRQEAYADFKLDDKGKAVSAGMKKALQAIDAATGGEWRTSPDAKKVWKYLYLKDQKGGISADDVSKATLNILKAAGKASAVGDTSLETDVLKAERVKYGTAVKPEVKDLQLQGLTVNGQPVDVQGVAQLINNPPPSRTMQPIAKLDGKAISYSELYNIVKRRSGILPERWAQTWDSESKFRNQADEAKLKVDVTKAANPQRTLLGNVAEAGVHFTENPLASMGVKGNPLTWVRTAVGGVARSEGNADIEAAIAEVEKEEGRKFSPEEKAAVFAQMEGIMSNKQSVAEYGTDALSLLVPMGSMSAAGRLARGAELGTASKLLSKVPTNTGQIANKILASKAGEIPLLARGVTAASKAVPDFVTTPFLAQQGAKGLDALGALSGDENSQERTGQLLESLKNPVNLALTSLGIYGGISAYRHNASVLKAGAAERALAKDAPLIQKRMEHIQAIGGAMGINGKTASQIAKETGIPLVDVKQVLATLSEGEGAVFEKTKNGRYRAARVTPEEVTVQPAVETPTAAPGAMTPEKYVEDYIAAWGGELSPEHQQFYANNADAVEAAFTARYPAGAREMTAKKYVDDYLLSLETGELPTPVHQWYAINYAAEIEAEFAARSGKGAKGPSVPRTDELAPDASRNTPTEVEAPQIAVLPDGLPHPTEFSKNAGDIGFLERAKAANLAALEAARERAKSNVIPTPRGKGRSGAKVSYTKELEVLFRVGIDHAFDLAIEMGGAAHVTYTKWAERMKPSVPEGVSMPGLWRVVRKRIGLPSGAEKSTVQSVLQTVSGKNIDTDAISKFLGYDIVKGKSLTLEQMEAAGARLERAIGKEQFGSVVDSIVAKASVPGTTLSTEDQVSLIYGMRRQADIVRKAAKDALAGGQDLEDLYTKADKKLQEIVKANRAVGTAASSAFRARRLELTAKDRAVNHKLQIKMKMKRQLKPEEAKAVDDIYDTLEHVNAEVKSAMSKRAYKAMSNYVEYKGKMPGEELQTAEQAATLERLRKEYLESVNKTHIGAIEAIPKGMRYVTNILWEKLRGGSTLERAVSTAIDEAYSIGIHLDEEDILAEFVARGLDSGSYEAAVAAQKLHEAELIRTGQATQGIIDTVSMRVDGQRFNYGFREAAGGIDQPEGAPRVIERSAQVMQGAEHNIRGDVPLGDRIEIREKVRQMTDAQFLALLQKKGLTLAQLQQPLLFTGKVDPETGEVFKQRIVVETTPEQAEALKLFQAKINAIRKRINLEADLPPFIAEEIAQGADPELIKMLEGLDIKSADMDDLAPILNMFRKRKKLLDMDTDEVLRNRANSPEMTPEAKAIFDKMAKEIKDLQALRNTEMRISKLVMDGKLDPDLAKAMTIEEAKTYADNVDKIERINKDIELIESGKKDLKPGPENAKFIDEQVWGALEHRRQVMSNMRNIERDLTHKEMLRLMGSIKQGKLKDFAKGAGQYVWHTGTLGFDFIRSSVASLDMSALFTQGGKAVMNPFFFKPWLEAARHGTGAMWSEANAMKYQAQLENTRAWAVGEQAGLHIRRDADVLSKGMGEDIFPDSAMNWIRHQGNKASIGRPSTWAAMIGGAYARPIIASARSMDVFSNSIRVKMFEMLAGGPEALAKVKAGSDMEHLQEVAEFVNNITGRATGKLGDIDLSKFASRLNNILFSGNYTVSAPLAYVTQPARGAAGMLKDIGSAVTEGNWVPVKTKAKLNAARMSGLAMPLVTMQVISQALEMSGTGYLDTDPHSNKFMKFRYWGSGDPNEGISVDLQPQLGQLLRSISGMTTTYSQSDAGVRYYDSAYGGQTPLKQSVDVDATKASDGYKAYIAEMRRRTGDPTYDIFNEDDELFRRYDRSKLTLAYKDIEENRFPKPVSRIDNALKVLLVWKFNPPMKYAFGLAGKLHDSATGSPDSTLGIDDYLPLREALPIGAQNAWDAVDRASGLDVSIGEFEQRFGKKAIRPETMGVVNGQTLSMMIVNLLALNASSDINEQVNFTMQDLRRAAEMWRKIKSGEINGSTPEGKAMILKFNYYWRDNAVYQKEYRDALKALTKDLDKIKKDASPEAKKEKKEPGRADLLAP